MTIRVSLAEYPDVNPIETSFFAFKFKNCERQIVLSGYLNRNAPKLYTGVINNPQISIIMDQLIVECDVDFNAFGHTDLADESYCSTVAYDVYNYDYDGEE